MRQGKYHKSCHSSYTSKVSKEACQSFHTKKDAFNDAFHELVCAITPELENGKGYTLVALTEMYKRLIRSKSINPETYRADKLKQRLKGHFQEKIVFNTNHQTVQRVNLFLVAKFLSEML